MHLYTDEQIAACRLYCMLDDYLRIFFCLGFFPRNSRFTGQQGKGEGISLTPLYHLHPLHRHLDISQSITAVSSSLHITSSRTYTENLRHETMLFPTIFVCNLQMLSWHSCSKPTEDTPEQCVRFVQG